MAAANTAASRPATGDVSEHSRLERIFGDVDAPFALVDLDAMWWNASEMLGRGAGKPIRVASKSVRCRALLERILDHHERFRGLMTFTLPETLWLHSHGFEDLLLAYPTTDRTALAELGRLDGEGRPIVMVDSTDHLDLIARAALAPQAPIRVCIEFDTSFWVARDRVKIGPKRSPIRTPDEVAALAREIVSRPGLELAGIMGYEGHIAGVGDRPLGKPLQGPAIRRMQRSSAAELADGARRRRGRGPGRRPDRAGQRRRHGQPAHDRGRGAVTELTAGSGFYAPTLFDRYSAFSLRPAAMFALPVSRRPDGRTATLLGGGYHASGGAGKDRLPEPYLPEGSSSTRRRGPARFRHP